jgi:hypothetical protein
MQFIGTNRAQVDHEPPQPLNQDPFLVNDDGTGTGNIEGDEDGDGTDIAGPRVEAHVDLAKTPRTYYCMTLCMKIYLTIFTVHKVYPDDITTEIGQPDFSHLIQLLIYNQEHPDSNSDITHISLTALPTFHGKISIYPSTLATFYAPSDICSAGGMCSECIHAVTSWRKGASRFDTVFVNTDSTVEGMWGLDVARM